MTAAGRREAILKVLEVRRFETRTNLAFEFGVSERTIENDIRLLMERYPIYTKPGYRGGIGVVEGATLVGKRMSLEETNFLEKMKSSTNEHRKAILAELSKILVVYIGKVRNELQIRNVSKMRQKIIQR